jgi:hypothetical protein
MRKLDEDGSDPPIGRNNLPSRVTFLWVGEIGVHAAAG